jgi:hypothetical protein
LISFDWVRLNTPATLARDRHTSPAAVRRNSLFFGFGGSAEMKAVSLLQKTMRNYPKLSWKSTTCDAWAAILIDLNRIADGLKTAPFAADLLPKFQ